MPTPASPGVSVNSACTTKKTGSTAVRRAMPTSRLSRYQARTRRAAIEAVGEVPSSTGRNRPRADPLPARAGERRGERAGQQPHPHGVQHGDERDREREVRAERPPSARWRRRTAAPRPSRTGSTTRRRRSASRRTSSGRCRASPVVSSRFIASGMSVTTETTSGTEDPPDPGGHHPGQRAGDRAGEQDRGEHAEHRRRPARPARPPGSRATTPTWASASPLSITAGMPVQRGGEQAARELARRAAAAPRSAPGRGSSRRRWRSG